MSRQRLLKSLWENKKRMKKITLVFFFIFFFVFLLFFPPATAATVIVNEGELVKIKAKVIDLDNDQIKLFYSFPLNASGEWQTTLEDAGTYNIGITAFDGKSYSEKNITLIVKNVNQPPVIVAPEKIIAEEGDLIKLNFSLFDPDNDEIKYSISPPFVFGEWQTGFEDAGIYNVTITATDHQFSVFKDVVIEVKNKNQLPEIVDYLPKEKSLKTKENSSLDFVVIGRDKDRDLLNFKWFLDNKLVENYTDLNRVSFYFDFFSAGDHRVKVEVCDPESCSSFVWEIEIEDLNRLPFLPEIKEMIIKEGDLIQLNLPEKDEDSQVIDYQISPPLEKGYWQTFYQDAGKYEIKITADDGIDKIKKKIKIIIEDVDLPPEMEIPSKREIKEGEEFFWELKASDPDGDEVVFSSPNLPKECSLEDSNLKCFFDYMTIKRSKYKGLNLLKNYLGLNKKEFSFDLKACGKAECSNKTAVLVVRDVNQRPELTAEDLTINEGELIKLKEKIKVNEPDGENLKFFFSSPFDKDGEWLPGFNASGNYLILIKVSDTFLVTEKEIRLQVLNKNLPPKLIMEKDYFEIDENQSLSFAVKGEDPDEDNLTISLENWPEGASFIDGNFSWRPDFGLVNKELKEKDFELFFVAEDEEFETKQKVNIKVRDKNQKPVILNATPEKTGRIFLGQSLILKIEAEDLDGDELVYFWESKGKIMKTEKPALKMKFTSLGEKRIKVRISDGVEEATKEWRIKVVKAKKK